MSHDAPKTVDFIYLVKIRHETQTHELYAREKVVEHHEEVKTFYDESTALSFFGRLVQDQTETHATRLVSIHKFFFDQSGRVIELFPVFDVQNMKLRFEMKQS
jgi:hypothetical protein